MNHQTWEWETSNQCKMFAQKWTPDKNCKASIILIHGLGEHSSRYDQMAKFYCDHQIQVLAFDVYGHGRSDGQRGHIPELNTFLDDIVDFREQVKDDLNGKPVFLYGHSMGGMIVLTYVLKKYPAFDGIITTSPLIDTAKPMDGFTKSLVRILNSIAPRMTINNRIDRSFLSRDARIVDAYNEDPLVFGKLSMRLGAFMVDSQQFIREHAAEFAQPLLMMVGSDEKIVSKADIDVFMQSLPQQTYKVWDGCFHELHNEPEKEKVFEYTLAWMKDHM